MRMTKKERPGYLIVFEGIDGAGKGTQIQLLYPCITQAHGDRTFTKEPGGTELGALIRMALFDKPGTKHLAPNVRQCLCLAAHIQHSQECIVPALQRGATVVCDRYLYSDFAYDEPTHEKSLDRARRTLMGPEPDLVVFLHGDPVVFQERAAARTTETHQAGKVWNDPEVLRQVQNHYFAMFQPLQVRGRLLAVAADRGTPEEIFEQQIKPNIMYRLKKHFNL